MNKHNEYRRKHNVPDLILDDNLNKEAQTYAQKLVGHGLDHDKSNNKSGENLYKGSSNNLGSSVDLWYNEYQFYNYESGGFSMKTGHFTQLVWKMTTSLGVGIAKDQNSWIVVCRYFPPGNVEGQYIQNVLKPKSKLK